MSCLLADLILGLRKQATHQASEVELAEMYSIVTELEEYQALISNNSSRITQTRIVNLLMQKEMPVLLTRAAKLLQQSIKRLEAA